MSSHLRGKRHGAAGGAKQRKGPLKNIVARLRHSDNIFTPDWVRLECGHETYAWGTYRARCTECAVPTDRHRQEIDDD